MTDQTEPTNETPADPKLLGQWAQMRMAHEAMMLDDAHATLAADRAAVRTHREQMIGPQGTPGDDDMGIHIGDVITTQQAPSTPPAKTSLSPLAKTAIAAALTAAGLPGAAMFADVLLSARTPPAAVVAPMPQIDAVPEISRDMPGDRDWELGLLPAE